jgi:hypothetical protein
LAPAGRFLGDVAIVTGWTVYDTRGAIVIEATALNQIEAWRRAVEQAKAVGMVRE